MLSAIWVYLKFRHSITSNKQGIKMFEKNLNGWDLSDPGGKSGERKG